MKKTIIRNLFSIDQHVDLYFEIIEDHLECPPEIRKKYMRFLRYEIARYLLFHPDAVMSDICQMFGDPYEQTTAVFKMMEKNHARELRKRTILFLVVVAVLIVLLVVAIGFAIHYSTYNDEYIYVSNAYAVLGGVVL